MDTVGFFLFGTAWWVGKNFGALYASAYFVFGICFAIVFWKRMADGQEDNGYHRPRRD